MAKKTTNKKNQFKHRDCVHARDFFDLNYKGEPILCRCDYAEFAILLNDKACLKHFKNKEK